jgi:hypothetical protein
MNPGRDSVAVQEWVADTPHRKTSGRCVTDSDHESSAGYRIIRVKNFVVVEVLLPKVAASK